MMYLCSACLHLMCLGELFYALPAITVAVERQKHHDHSEVAGMPASGCQAVANVLLRQVHRCSTAGNKEAGFSFPVGTHVLLGEGCREGERGGQPPHIPCAAVEAATVGTQTEELQPSSIQHRVEPHTSAALLSVPQQHACSLHNLLS
jgi:hypothetical protein